jgi:hypothetical protein
MHVALLFLLLSPLFLPLLLLHSRPSTLTIIISSTIYHHCHRLLLLVKAFTRLLVYSFTTILQAYDTYSACTVHPNEDILRTYVQTTHRTCTRYTSDHT